MPEYPEMELYRVALERQLVDHTVQRAKLLHPFFLRSVGPRVDELAGRRIIAVERLAKRTIFVLEPELYAVVHLMIVGRFRWRKTTAKDPGKRGMLRMDFEHGSLFVTEEGSKRRASLHLLQTRDELADHDRGGLEVHDIDLPTFTARLQSERHTLKRALADPKLFSAIGNAWSDEILLEAQLSPFARTDQLDAAAIERLFHTIRARLTEGRAALLEEWGDRFPEKVTAFHASMRAHGRFGQPCVHCETPIQRIVYAENECNYCPKCQTDGKVLKDRALSRLLKDDWPRSIDEL